MDGVLSEGKCIIILDEVQRKEPEQLHSNHMGMYKTMPLVHESIYWVNMNADIENDINIVAHLFVFSRHSLRTESFIIRCC